jgi:hypothetical protein
MEKIDQRRGDDNGGLILVVLKIMPGHFKRTTGFNLVYYAKIWR